MDIGKDMKNTDDIIKSINDYIKPDSLQKLTEDKNKNLSINDLNKEKFKNN